MAKTLEYPVEEITDRIIEHLYWDDRLRSANIQVAVEDGTVRLSGTVPTYAALRAAGLHALLSPGIHSVDNQLRVRYKKGLPLPSDADLTQHIAESYAWNAHIDAAKISVQVRDGIVLLKGTVEAYWQKQKAEAIAAEMLGVMGIENMITVTPLDEIDDAHLAEDITLALVRNIGPVPVTVKVENSVALLSGGLPSSAVYKAVLDIVSRSAGLADIVNRLNIK